MISTTRPAFWRFYASLDPAVRTMARRAFRQFELNPAHPSLRFKKLAGSAQVWSVRINDQYRAVGERHGERMIWSWIGSHNDFDKLFG